MAICGHLLKETKVISSKCVSFAVGSLLGSTLLWKTSRGKMQVIGSAIPIQTVA